MDPRSGRRTGLTGRRAGSTTTRAGGAWVRLAATPPRRRVAAGRVRPALQLAAGIGLLWWLMHLYGTEPVRDAGAVLRPSTLVAAVLLGLLGGVPQGAAASAYDLAGLDPAAGFTTSIAYGLLALVSTSPGAGVLLMRWVSAGSTPCRRPRPTPGDVTAA